MEIEKVKEIKKAIEYNVLSEFMNRLPYADKFNKLKMVSFEDILTLINELESENEELSKQCQEWSELSVEWSELNFKKKKQVVELKDRIAELEHKCNDCAGCTQWKCDCANIEKHAVEQFAERLKGITCEMYLKEQLHRCIDETLKEFI